jgi:hypothetical protein
MSIILEALRKAEASRRGTDHIELAAAPVRDVPLRSRIPVGFVAAAATLFLAVGVGAWLLWPDEPAGEAAVASRAPAPRSGPAPVASPSQARPAARATSPGNAPAAVADPDDSADTADAAIPPVDEPDAPPAASAEAARTEPDASSDVRMLALEARAAEPAAPSPPAEASRGSVEVRDLLGSGAPAGADAPRIKPGSVEVRDLLAEQGAEPVPPESGEPARPAAATPASAARTSAPPPGAAVPPQAAQPPRADPDVPSLDQLVANGQLSPPDLSLDMHAYSPDVAARFVYINMRRYRIGDTTREGAVVEDITPDGVVLQLQGRRFVLSAR